MLSNRRVEPLFIAVPSHHDLLFLSYRYKLENKKVKRPLNVVFPRTSNDIASHHVLNFSMFMTVQKLRSSRQFCISNNLLDCISFYLFDLSEEPGAP